MAKRKTAKTISTGIAGLDEVLRGGLPTSNLYMLQGAPGAGKTTAALQFLRAGVEAGERCIYCQPVPDRCRARVDRGLPWLDPRWDKSGGAFGLGCRQRRR